MKTPQPLNKLAVWLPMNTDKLSIKAFDTGYPYLHKGIVRRSDHATPITRYAKNYTKKGVKYSLCIITTESDTKKIEAWLDAESKKLNGKDIEPRFKMLEVYYETQQKKELEQ